MSAVDAALVTRWQQIVRGGRAHRINIHPTLLGHTGASYGLPPLPIDQLRMGRAAGPGEFTAAFIVPPVAFAGVDWRPTGWASPLNVWGSRIDFTATATAEDNGDQVTIPLGRGVVESWEEDWPAGPITITCGDVTLDLEQTDILEDRPLPADRATPINTLVPAMVTAYAPNLGALQGASLLPSTVLAAAQSWDAGTNLLDLLLSMARTGDRSLVLTGGRDGRLWVKRLRTNTGAPANVTPRAVIASGEGGHLSRMKHSMTRRDAINWVRVIATDPDVTDATWTADAKITNASPLAIPPGGTIGYATRLKRESLRGAGKPQAQQLANFELGTTGGLPRQITLTTTPMPWLDPGDVIQVKRGDADELVQVVSWDWTYPAGFTLKAKAWSAVWESGLPEWPALPRQVEVVW